MKRAMKRGIARTLPPRDCLGLRVLLYHAVGLAATQDRLGLQVTPGAFRQHLELLREEGYRVVPLRDALSVRAGGERQVAITFDDGYRSQFAAADILQEAGYPATMFLVPAYLDGGRPSGGYWASWEFMGWEEARALAARGFEIGAHSMTHPERLTACSPERLREETAGAKAAIEARLGRPVESFSYPHGRHDARTVQAIASAGFRIGCTSLPGLNDARCPRLTLRRTEISGQDSLQDVARKLAGQYDWVGAWQRWSRAYA